VASGIARILDGLRRAVGPRKMPRALPPGTLPPRAASLAEAWLALTLRWKRQRLLWRAFHHRRDLTPLRDRTAAILPGQILAAVTVRNEMLRLPFFLDHHRRLGVDHFLFVDNDSTDGTRDWLAAQPDVSVWSTGASYKASRFGVDWTTWLQLRHAHGHWCLTLDADELLIYPNWETRPLRALTEWLDRCGHASMGAMMLDLYPKGPIGDAPCDPGQNPLEVLQWFDRGNHSVQVQPRMRNLWIQGGVRGRVFFADTPRQSPTLNKTPLVRWNRRYAYVNSTHSLLPRHLNEVYDQQGGERTTGLLLHTKFLNVVVEKSAEEKRRGQHFGNAGDFAGYYDRVTASPDLWSPASTRLSGWRQLEALGLMSRGGWV
jgi:glycosyltransferase involved in cell wall biosynthesis